MSIALPVVPLLWRQRRQRQWLRPQDRRGVDAHDRRTGRQMLEEEFRVASRAAPHLQALKRAGAPVTSRPPSSTRPDVIGTTPEQACLEMIQVLRRTGKPDAAIRLVCGDAAALPLPEGVLDFVACFNAVHHLHLDAFFEASTRQVRPGGHVFVYTRTLDQNARSIWGRRFPGFSDKETRLFQRDRLERAVRGHRRSRASRGAGVSLARRAAADVLETRVRARAYSTFSLYGEAELAEALNYFVAPSGPARSNGPTRTRW